jgi:hypothetical protein
VYWCFQCYGINDRPAGACVHCGGEIAMPEGSGYEEQLIWTLGHPDGDRAIIAARTLGIRRARGAAPQLRDLACSHADPFLAAESLRSLIAIEGAEALVSLLVKLADKENAFMVQAVAEEALWNVREWRARRLERRA